jgi:glycoside/pentoside/hexuronide:cation symporter, GPH family
MRIKLGFGVGDLGGNMFFTIIGFYLLYYLTDVVRLPAALAGTALMIGKIWDAVTDPVTGYASDRTVSRWGRRRPYIFAGSIGCFFGMILMFSTPQIDRTIPLFLVITFYFCLLNLAYTLVNIPYAALLPELTDDFDQRTVLTGYRMSFAVVGTLVGAGAVLPIIQIFGGGRSGWLWMGGITGFIILLTSMLTVIAVREPERSEPEKGDGFFKTYMDTLGLKVFLQALLPWVLFIGGTSVVQGSLLYYFKYIYGDEALFQTALIFLLVTSLLCIPVWVILSKKIGKRGAYMAGMGIVTIGVLIFAFGGAAGRISFAYFIMVVSGTGLSTHYIMPHSILPDVVEYDVIKSGIRREGTFSSLWTFGSKIGQAVALAITGFVLDIFRYKPDTDLEPFTLLGIRLLCGPVPAIFYIAGIIILAGYPISREYYSEMIGSGKIPDSIKAVRTRLLKNGFRSGLKSEK